MGENITALVGSIQKFSTEDGPGVRSTVFLKGCPLKCKWCHNPEMIGMGQQMIVSPNKCIGCMTCVGSCPNNGIKIGENGPQIDWEQCTACGTCAENCYSNAIRYVAEEMSVQDVFDIVVQDKGFYDSTGGGVTISGGELLTYPEFSRALIEKCGSVGIRVCIDTSGFSQFEVLNSLAELHNIQFILYDMKTVDKKKHLLYTGVDNGIIIENLRRLSLNPEIRPKIWMRMPLIKGVNDDAETIARTKELYSECGIKRVTLMAYHDYGNSKAERIGEKMPEFKAPSDSRINEIKVQFEGIGMEVEISGQGEQLA